MTPEELMKPRYEVIADYPGSRCAIGEIFTQHPRANNSWSSSLDDCRYGSAAVPSFGQYPHLFKALKWYENRPIEDMPKYLRVIANMRYGELEKGSVFRADRNLYTKNDFPLSNYMGWLYDGIYISFFEPATQDEWAASQARFK